MLLPPFEEDGLVRTEPERLIVTAGGQLFLRNLATVFDPYLRGKGESPAQFSRAL